MITLNFKHLRYFWRVAKAGSITRASELLHLTPQSISGQLTTLENALGVRALAVRLYAAGEASIAELLDGYRIAEQAQLARIEALGTVLNARLALMRASGTQFDAALDEACGTVTGAR